MRGSRTIPGGCRERLQVRGIWRSLVSGTGLPGRIGLIVSSLWFGVQPIRAQTEVWRIGTGGESWGAHGEIVAAVDVRGASALRPNGFTVDDNIVAAVTWEDAGTGPQSYVQEGQARVWARVADGQSNLVMVDGSPSTSTGDRFQAPGARQSGRIFVFDLGASFPAESIVFYPNPDDSSAFIRAYQLEISDGQTFTSDGRPKYELLRRVEVTTQIRADVRFTRQLLRFIKLTTLATNPFDLAEIEVYGEGFVPRAQYVTRFIDFEESVNFGTLQLQVERVTQEVERQSAASVMLRVRNGDDDTPLVFYQIDLETQEEIEITAAEYDVLPEIQRTQRYDAANWSAWSNPLEIDTTGTYELDLSFLPGPRRFFQFSLSFTGTDREVMRVSEIEVTHSQSLTSSAAAEVALLDDPVPVNNTVITSTGERATFVYGVRGTFDGGEAGFDGIRIETPPSAAFQSLAIGEIPEEIEPDSVSVDQTGISVFFPSRRVTAANSEPVLITFETTPLLYKTLFRGWLLDTGGHLPQLLNAGDGHPDIGSRSLQVFGSLAKPLGGFDLSSGYLTPNGDGVNDAVEVFYDLIYLVEPAWVELTVLDLSGRRVRDIFSGDRGAGTFTGTWNGRDGAGELVPPGHYVLKLVVDTQSDSFERLRNIGVVY